MRQILRAQEFGQAAREFSNEAPVSRNASSFATQRWQDHFDSLGKGAIVADTISRALHYWSADGQTYKVYPTSVPATEELTKRKMGFSTNGRPHHQRSCSSLSVNFATRS